MNNCSLPVEMVFLLQKTLTFLQKRQYCKTLLQNFDGEILVYDLAAPHSNNREWVVMELEMILCAAKTPNLVTL